VIARLGLLTVSDTRTPRSDRSGAEMRRLVEAAGHRVYDQRIVPDDPERVRAVLAEWLAAESCDGALLSGGTGISPRDATFETVVGLLDKRLDGFGELFRMLSWDEVGSAAMLSRAVGGTVGRRVVFSLPGSTAAVRLAVERLILPEIGHLLAQLRGQ